jgi:exodeoxyribonuclease VII large subunit
LESTVNAVVSGHAMRLSEHVIQLQERARARMNFENQHVENARSRFEDSIWRHLQLAEEVNSQNLDGLLEGTRKYLDWKSERFQRWAITLHNAIDKAISHRLGLLATSAVLLEERIRGNQEDEERDLAQRESELRAVFGRFIHARQVILDLKTSRFGLSQYDRILDQTLRNLDEKGKRLSALSPEQLLTRGYSITRDEKGHIIRNAEQVQEGQTIHTQLAHGSLTSILTQKEGSDDE